MVFTRPPGLEVDLLKDIFPSKLQLDEALQELCGDALDRSIEILDPLIPPESSSSGKGKVRQASNTDRRGFSRYARTISAMTIAFLEDRQLARRNLWAMRHFFALSIYSQDLLNISSSASRSPVFDDKVTLIALSDIVSRVKQISVYTLSAGRDDGKWRAVVLDRLLNDDVRNSNVKGGLTSLQELVFDVVTHAKNGDVVRDSRVLKLVLEPLFKDDLDTTEADKWVQLSRKYEKAGEMHFFMFTLGYC